MSLVYLFIGVIIGGIIGYLFAKNKQPQSNNSVSDEDVLLLKEQIEAEKNKFSSLQVELATVKSDFKNKDELAKQYYSENEKLKQQFREISDESTAFKTKVEHLEKLLTEQKEELLQIQNQYTEKFKIIAHEAIEQQAKKQLEIGEKRIEEILKPLNTDLKNFKETVNNTYIKNTQERASLKEEIKQLTALNSAMREDAKKLTNALTQDSKKQGNWGELVLEKILEKSGLVKDREYTMQFSTTSAEGNRIQPDVVVDLPDNKHIIIDSKVSLTAYNNLINCEDEEERKVYLKAHLDSIKQHINGLSEKAYQLAENINSPDFVLLFLPIESSFSIATQADDNLFNMAWSKNIVIVSPSTLLATLKTIASLWKHEYQNRNVLEIARLAGTMYDKFFGFIKDMEDIGNRLRQADDSYSKAMNKLQHGSGNLLNTAQKVKKLGAKTKKDIGEKYAIESPNNTEEEETE